MLRIVRMLVVLAAFVPSGCSEWGRDVVLTPEEVMAAAEAGDAAAAFRAYQIATTDVERRKWVCLAANRDYPPAQAEIAHLHWNPVGSVRSPFKRDAYTAYVWSAIATQRRHPLDQMEERLGWIVTNGERWRAMLLAVSWRPDPSQCDDMAASGYFKLEDPSADEPPYEDVLAAARAGDARSALQAYRRAQTDAERRRWICVAATRNLPEAQAEIAQLHLRPAGGRPSPFGYDEFRAYVWSVIAIQNQRPLDETEREFGWVVARGERWWAMALAVAWRSDPAQCDDMESSAYFNIVQE